MSKDKSEFTLTGRHIVMTLIVFFGIIFSVNGLFLYKSISSFPGEDIKQSYRQGLAYNETLESRAAQRASGWRADLAIDGLVITMTILDTGDIPVRGLSITGLLKHPTETDLDTPLVFTSQADGSYVAALETSVIGKRFLTTKAATTDGFVFETKNELWLK